MTEKPQATPPLSVAVSVDGRIAEDKDCIECGYNLRGLKTDGLCPECAGEIAASLRGHDLHYASLPWLRVVARGFQFMKLAAIMALLALCFSLLTAALVMADMSEIWESIIPVFAVLMCLVCLVGAGSVITGFILSTRAEPRLAGREDWRSKRRLSRLLAAATLALCAVSLLIEGFSSQASGLVDFVVLYLPPVLALTALLTVLIYVQYVAVLLRRTAEQKTLKAARDAIGIMYMAIGLASVVFLTQTLAPIFKSNAVVTAGLDHVANFANGCGGCANLLMFVAIFVLAWRVASTMKRIVSLAEEGEKARATASPENPSANQ